MERPGGCSTIDFYRAMHERGMFPGHSLKAHVETIRGLIVETGSTSLLDYGCGKGFQYNGLRLHEPWGVMPSLYDPGVPGIDIKPTGKFDGVICTDVMEHIEESDIDSVLDEIFGYAEKFVFLSICTRPAKKLLPDGRNCHLTVKPEDWWDAKLKGRRPRYQVAYV